MPCATALRIVVISLPTAVDRRRSASAALGHYELAFEFLDAIDGAASFGAHFRKLDLEKSRLNTYRNPLPGEIGCYASHLSVWRRCVDLGVPLLVLEDDFELLPAFPAALPLVAQLVAEYGFLRLESADRRRAVGKQARPALFELGRHPSHRLVYVSDVPTCLTAYALSPSAAAGLIAASETLVAPVDKFLQRTWEHRTPIFALEPPIVRTSSLGGVSTIGRRKALKLRGPRLVAARAIYKGIGEIRRIRFDRHELRRLGYQARREASRAAQGRQRPSSLLAHVLAAVRASLATNGGPHREAANGWAAKLLRFATMRSERPMRSAGYTGTPRNGPSDARSTSSRRMDLAARQQGGAEPGGSARARHR